MYWAISLAVGSAVISIISAPGRSTFSLHNCLEANITATNETTVCHLRHESVFQYGA
jgi:hypothetical protein